MFFLSEVISFKLGVSSAKPKVICIRVQDLSQARLFGCLSLVRRLMNTGYAELKHIALVHVSCRKLAEVGL